MLTRRICESTGSRFVYRPFKPVCLSFALPKRSPLATHRRDVIMPINMSLLLRPSSSFRWVTEKWVTCEEKMVWTNSCMSTFSDTRVIKSFENATLDATWNSALHVQISNTMLFFHSHYYCFTPLVCYFNITLFII